VEALQFLSGVERQLVFTPGTQFLTTNYGWIMVSAAAERASGEPFTVFMQKQVFEPLGMNAWSLPQRPSASRIARRPTSRG
jgi:CubicO group peptidase (beta-lactamase class C family)